MAGYWEIPEKCRNCRKKYNDYKGGNKGNYVCNCLPHWFKPITMDIKCPKEQYGDTAGTLRSICR